MSDLIPILLLSELKRPEGRLPDLTNLTHEDESVSHILLSVVVLLATFIGLLGLNPKASKWLNWGEGMN